MHSFHLCPVNCYMFVLNILDRYLILYSPSSSYNRLAMNISQGIEAKTETVSNQILENSKIIFYTNKRIEYI